jgi:murein DD-endopeptidase MepM/ murein hydrolase activator NlpD
MDKKKTTILIVGYEGDSVKSFQINTHFIKNFRKYLLGTGSLFSALLLLFTAIFLNVIEINLENGRLTSKIHSLYSKQILADSLKLDEKLKNIDYNLSQINNYLVVRGILPLTNQGGEISKSSRDEYSQINTIENQSIVFLSTLKSIPLGLPYNGNVTSDYGYRSNPFGGYSSEFHPGIDLKGPYGDPIFATADGVIENSDWNGGYGNAVIINHEFGYTTLYGHLSRVNVSDGERINAGDLIGFIGSTGRSTGPHLHYEIRRNGEDIDPIPFLKLNL